MQFEFTLTITLSLLTTTIAQRCGTPEPTLELKEISRRLGRRLGRAARNSTLSLATTLTIETYFHVLISEDGEGDIDDNTLTDQVCILQF
jgi:hypothetical protein